MMHRNRSVSAHQFAMVPRADIPRASFRMDRALKTTFDAGVLVPIYCEEVLPGDSFRLKMTAFARMSTPIFPVMDNLHMDTFFFFVPNRIIWDNWERFMGAQDDPGDSTSFVIPIINNAGAGGYAPLSLFDYFGLPTEGQIVGGGSWSHSVLPLRAYNLIWNEWFRDENLQDSVPVPRGDGPDSSLNYTLLRRGKRHDYFTSCLPWPQKGDSVSLPLGISAPVMTSLDSIVSGPQAAVRFADQTGFGAPITGTAAFGLSSELGTTGAGALPVGGVYPSNLFADLSQATAATINQLRQSFQIQKLLERDARGGTRYTEIVRAHFGVMSPDARLQRPEYLGGGSTPIVINPIAQTSGTGASGQSSPQGNLAAIGTVLSHGNGFSQSFTEHGHIIGLCMVRADLSYQQGMRKFWSRRSRFDFYFPAFAMLGEQAVLRKEIYIRGVPAEDDLVFGYQERWAEYRYSPSQITGLFKSTSAGTIDAWHLAQRFTAPPVLGATFIEERPPVDRVIAVGGQANGQQFIFDSVFEVFAARPLPLYSVPGLIDHF